MGEGWKETYSEYQGFGFMITEIIRDWQEENFGSNNNTKNFFFM